MSSPVACDGTTSRTLFSERFLRCGACVIPLSLLLNGCTISRHLLYSPDNTTFSEAWIHTPPQPLTAHTSNQIALNGHFWAGTAGDPDLFLFFHGRNWNVDRGANFAQHLAGHGNAVLVASYRGFGHNPGTPSQDSMMQDALAFIDLAEDLAGPDARIWLIGHSIGAAVALHAAADPRVSGVIAMSAFSQMAAAAPPLARPFIPDPWNNLNALQTLHKPVIFVQGALDRFIPDDSGDALFSAYKGPASLVVGEESRHNPDIETLAPWLGGAIRAMQDGILSDLPDPPPGWVEKVRRP